MMRSDSLLRLFENAINIALGANDDTGGLSRHVNTSIGKLSRHLQKDLPMVLKLRYYSHPHQAS